MLLAKANRFGHLQRSVNLGMSALAAQNELRALGEQAATPG
jgi:hypothetical protein